MAVPEQTPYIEHIANGVTTSFALEFECKDKEHLIVLVDNVEPNVGTWSLANGSVVFGTAPADGKIISIQRNTPFRRDTNFQSYDNSLRPATINKDFDWIWFKLQELGVADWILGNRIDALKNYVDDRDDELRAYLLEEIRKQGVALDQLDDYYNYLMQRLAQIAVDKGWDASFVVDGNLTQHERNLGIKSIAQLRLTNPSKKGDRVFLASVNEDQNEGGGDFIATQKAGLIDDGGMIISSPDPLIFWCRINYDHVTPEMFGYPINTEALQRSIDHGAEVALGYNDYKSTKPVKFRNGLKITGVHPDHSRIVKSTTSTVEIEGVGELDCAVYMAGNEAVSNQIFLKNVGVTKEQIAGADVGVGAYFRYTARSSLENFWVLGGETAIKTYDTWMVSWIRCEGKAANPWDLNVGTSNTFTDCWAITGKNFGWKAFNLMYSSMINSGADYTGSDGNPAEAVYHFTGGCTVTMLGCASEHSHAYNLIYAHNSQVDAINAKHMQFHNKYVHTDVNRRGIICVGDYDTILNISGGDYSAEYSSSDASYVPWGCVQHGALNLKNARLTRAIFDIKDADWGITALDYALINYEQSGLTQTIDNRVDDTNYNNHSYTEKSFGFKSRTMPSGGVLSDLRNSLDKFVYVQNSPDAPIYPDAPNKCHVINMSDYNGDGIESMFAQMAFNLGASHVSYRWGDAGYEIENWIEFLTRANTTVDANGFIKSASPIVKLFSDRIEKNNETPNSVEFKKIGVGNYVIKGSSGFSNDGWYIETPKDANGNVLFSIGYTMLENGDISVKTYKKKFDIETASIVADIDNPVDIIEGRWVDIRLN